MSRDFDNDLSLAHRLADEAEVIGLAWFRRRFSPDTKSDGSPVTAADLEIESQIRMTLMRERPFDIVLGEEFSDPAQMVQSASPTWIVDPIDHTRHFARGEPNYGTLIALTVGGLTRVAVISAPSLGLRWSAIRGGGAFANGSRIEVSAVADLRHAHLALAGHREWVNCYDWTHVLSLMNQVAYVCGTAGGFLPAMKVASSQLDAFVEPWGSIWDHAALALVVEEAGGRASTLSGGAVVGGSLLVSNGILHEQLLDHFRQKVGM